MALPLGEKYSAAWHDQHLDRAMCSSC